MFTSSAMQFRDAKFQVCKVSLNDFEKSPRSCWAAELARLAHESRAMHHLSHLRRWSTFSLCCVGLASVGSACGASDAPAAADAPDGPDAQGAEVGDASSNDASLQQDAGWFDGAPPDRRDAADADAGGACARTDPFPAPLSQEAALLVSGTARIEFTARDGNQLGAYVHRAANFDPNGGRILFVIHGSGRDAEGYLRAFDDIIERQDALGIAPEWPQDLYPTSELFNLGVGRDGEVGGQPYDPQEWRDPSEYTLSEVEHLFEAVKATLGSSACDYRIYGHSAGAQFVHRLLTFRPDARVARAVVANAGWYTLASEGDQSANYYVPYGLVGAPPDATRLNHRS